MAEHERVSIPEVLHAGRVLFGPSFVIEGSWRDELKSAFRRRALETHPDRAEALGRTAVELALEFNAVNDAYRFLAACAPSLSAKVSPRARSRARAQGGQPKAKASPESPRPSSSRKASPPHSRPQKPHRARAAPTHPQHPQRARPPETPTTRAANHPTPPAARATAKPWCSLPRRPLRFAEYLYYTGRVHFTELVEAIVWQRRQRPPMGRIAIEFGFLTEDDVLEILVRRHEAHAHEVPFGEFAVRTGYLTPFQLLAIIGRQRGLQRPIGQFFVERGLLDPSEIDEIRHRIFLHNASCAS